MLLNLVELCRGEIFAMCNEQWALPGAPLLVLACVPHIDSVRTVSCVTIVNCLQLQKMNRPWQV